MRIFLTNILINIIFIYTNEIFENDSFILKNDTMNDIIENLDKIISEIFDEIEININDDLIENEILIDDNLKEIIFDDNLDEIKFENDEIIKEKNIIEFEDSEDDESILPEKTIPKFKFIV